MSVRFVSNDPAAYATAASVTSANHDDTAPDRATATGAPRGAPLAAPAAMNTSRGWPADTSEPVTPHHGGSSGSREESLQTSPPDVPPQYLTDPLSLGTYGGYEVYLMPVYVRFAVASPVSSAEWYRRALGFGLMYAGPEVDGVPVVLHLRRRKYQDLLLVPGPTKPLRVCLDATGELDALADRATGETPIERLKGPTLTPWGARELDVTDPDGNTVTFFEAPQKPPATVDEAVRDVASAKTGHRPPDAPETVP